MKPFSPIKLGIITFLRNIILSSTVIFFLSLLFSSIILINRIHFTEGEQLRSLVIPTTGLVGGKQSSVDLLNLVTRFKQSHLKPVPANLYETIRNKQNIQFEDNATVTNSVVSWSLPFLIVGEFETQTPIVATDSSLKNILKSNSQAQIKFDFNLLDSSDDIAVISKELADKLRLNLNSTIEIQLKHPDGSESPLKKKLKILDSESVFGNQWDQVIFIPLKTGQKWIAENFIDSTIWKDKILHGFLLSLTADHEHEIKSLINDRTVAQYINLTEEKEKLENIVGRNQNLEFFFSSVLILTAIISILLVHTLRLRNQLPQIATLRALGHSRLWILTWQFTEFILLFFISAIFSIFEVYLVWQNSLQTIFPWDNASMTHIKYISVDIQSWVSIAVGFLIAFIAPVIVTIYRNIHKVLRV